MGQAQLPASHAVLAAQLVAGYAVLAVLQIYGREIIIGLHGASRLAELDALDRDAAPPPRSFYPFCQFYESHHQHPISNGLHTCGCISAICCLALAIYQLLLYLVARRQTRELLRDRRTNRLLLVAYWVVMCPVPYYCFNWAGHFLLQRDIPAVFTWAFDGQLVVWGEMCQFRQVAKRWIGYLPETPFVWPTRATPDL